MYLEERNGLRILVPMKNYRICTKDKTQVFDGKVYLGKNDTMENYIALTENEAIELQQKLESEANAHED